MRIIFKTSIERDFHEVARGFNQGLFEYLIPSYCLPVVKRYDGQDHGDMVHLSFRFPGINDWKVVVKESGMSEKSYWLVHRGLVMPFRLSFWQHIHRVVSLGKHKCAIIDHIEFDSKWKILNPINYLLLLFIFLPRRILYRRYFHKINAPERKTATSNQ